MRRFWLAALAGGACAWHASCEPAAEVKAMGTATNPEPVAERPPPAEAAPPAAEPATDNPEAAPPPLSAGQMATIPAGPLRAGSATASVGRNPAREVDLVEVDLPAFEIDRLPYPNDPAKPAMTGVSREQASSLCGEHGKRLCHELEWERACGGPRGAAFVTGRALDPQRCGADVALCGNAEGVHAMGSAVREWTASDALEGLGNGMRTAVVRGADGEANAHGRRCAARSAVTPDTVSKSLGFRCCRGTSEPPDYPALEADQEVTRASGLDADAQAKVLAAVPELAQHARGFTPFSRSDVDAALRRGRRSRGGISYWAILPSSVLWSPVRGEQLLVLSGAVERGALVAVLHVLADGEYKHAASTVVHEEDTSIALGVSEEHRGQLIWTTCFDCPGEGGAIVWGEDAQVQFGFR
ncbi:MAG: hypothetical protein OXT09_03295 [Myxococcales bacterium]|nr:hypothetical protein [Myxococcales bacterium]